MDVSQQRIIFSLFISISGRLINFPPEMKKLVQRFGAPFLLVRCGVLHVGFPTFVSSVCLCKLSCEEGHSGPTHEALQAVFDLQAFRPAANLSRPTTANISFTLYAVLGVVGHLRHKPFKFKF